MIEPELSYHYVGGIGARERNVLLVDTDDIATDTNEAEVSVTQRFYVRPTEDKPCPEQDKSEQDKSAPREQAAEPDQRPESGSESDLAGGCPAKPREWASWQVAQKFYFDPTFGGALIPNRRNVFDTTLDLTGVAFLTAPRNLTPII